MDRRLQASPLFLCIALSFACRSRSHSPGQPSEPSPDPVRILQFYAAESLLPLDQSTNLCYGVENASAVRISPPVEHLWPALSRCIAVSPRETTTYTLT